MATRPFMKQLPHFILLLSWAVSSLACKQVPSPETTANPERFLNEKRLYVTLESNLNDYFLYRGQPMGFQLELLESFAAYIGCDLVILPGTSIEEQLAMVQRGEADIVASNLHISEKRCEKAAFSNPVYHTAQVLVQLAPAYLSDTSQYVTRMEELSGKEVHIRENSIFEETIRQYNRNTTRPDWIRTISRPLTEEALLLAVSRGDIPYTIVSANKASHFTMAYPQTDCHLVLSPTQPVAWAMNRQADSLCCLVNRWIDSLAHTQTLDYLYHKYYEIPFEKTARSVKSGFRKMDSLSLKRKLKQREYLIREGVLDEADSAFLFENHRTRSRNEKVAIRSGEISPFDRLLKKYSRQIPWDWRLLASLIYQESQFQNHLVSNKGAIGLMQMMPTTARRYNITVRSTEEAQIRAGVRYIRSIYRALPAEIPTDQQVYFVLAAYNVGLGHILDARRLAQKYGADPNIWYGNTETYLARKSSPQYYRDTASRNGYANGKQTVDFVRKIEKRYMHYRNLTR